MCNSLIPQDFKDILKNINPTAEWIVTSIESYPSGRLLVRFSESILYKMVGKKSVVISREYNSKGEPILYYNYER